MQKTAADFERVLKALHARRLKIHVPQTKDLFRRKPQAYFHATPELFIQMGGATDFVCPAEGFRLGTHEVCVMPTGVPHAETPVDLATPYSLLVCMQARDGFMIQRAAASPRREIRGVSNEHLASPRGRSAFRYLDEIAGAMLVPEKHRGSYIASLLEAFLATLLGELDRPSATLSSRSPLVAEAEKMARTLMSDSSLSVAKLASVLNCSSDYLSRRFHAERGVTLTTWITRERIIMAQDILSHPDCNIAEVGWACGFSAPSYFIRVFRQQTGLTPRAYRLGILTETAS